MPASAGIRKAHTLARRSAERIGEEFEKTRRWLCGSLDVETEWVGHRRLTNRWAWHAWPRGAMHRARTTKWKTDLAAMGREIAGETPAALLRAGAPALQRRRQGSAAEGAASTPQGRLKEGDRNWKREIGNQKPEEQDTEDGAGRAIAEHRQDACATGRAEAARQPPTRTVGAGRELRRQGGSKLQHCKSAEESRGYHGSAGEMPRVFILR